MMNLQKYKDLFLPKINQEILTSLEDSFTGVYPELSDAIHYHFAIENGAYTASTGKRIRPLLILLTADLLEMEWKALLPAAAAVEMLHNFTLIHDDIEDNSDMRRGRTTVWKIWGREKGINIGDALFAISTLTMLRLEKSFRPKIVLSGVNEFISTSYLIMQGQQMDMDFEEKDIVRSEQYLEMIRGKTAALLAFSSRISAIMNGSPRETTENLNGFGESLGLAFQIYDDWLGIWGDQEKTGKPAYSDFIERKKSFPILLGLEQSKEFRTLWSTKERFSKQDCLEMASVLRAEGIEKQVLEEADKISNLALDYLYKVNGRENAKNALIELSHALLDRRD